MERENDLSPEARETLFRQALAAEAVTTFAALEADDSHFMMLPDEVLGNRTGWQFTPAKDVDVLGRLQACWKALEEYGALIESFATVQVSIDVPMANETTQTTIEPRAVLFVYKPSDEAVQQWREKTERPRPHR
jgi:hypothetical protein